MKNISCNRYNEPQRLEMKNATKEEITNPRNRNNKQNVLMTFLTGMKSGTKVFQHFLTKSNLSQHMSGNLALLKSNAMSLKNIYFYVKIAYTPSSYHRTMHFNGGIQLIGDFTHLVFKNSPKIY